MTKTGAPDNWIVPRRGGPRTLAEKAYEALHAAIVSGELAPGERLRIETLAEALNMSHLPIREAIRQLESRGLVEHIPHRGGRVTEISLEDLRQLYDARLVIEPGIIQRAAEVFTQEHAAAAQTALERHITASRTDNLAEAWSAHTDFHFALYGPSGSTWLLRMTEPLWESSQRYRLTIPPLNSANRRREAQAEHEEMLEACIRHEGERAARVLHNHLVRTANLIVDQMGGRSTFVMR